MDSSVIEVMISNIECEFGVIRRRFFCLFARDSWFVVRGSGLVARGSWLVARGSWLVVRGLTRDMQVRPEDLQTSVRSSD